MFAVGRKVRETRYLAQDHMTLASANTQEHNRRCFLCNHLQKEVQEWLGSSFLACLSKSIHSTSPANNKILGMQIFFLQEKEIVFREKIYVLS